MYQSNQLNLPYLGKLEIVEVYIYYDAPRLFACRNQAGQFFLAVWVGENEDYENYYYLPLSRKRFDFIRSGGIDLYDAYKLSEDGIVYEVLFDRIGNPLRTNCLNSIELEDENLPVPGETIELETETLALPPEWSVKKEAKETWRESVVLSLNSPEIKRNEAPAAILGSMLSLVQELINAFAQSFSGKKATKLSSDTLDNNKLFVAGLVPGSFGVLLHSSVSGDLFGKTEISKALSEFVSLVEAGVDEESLKEHLLNLRGSSPQKFKQLLSQIASSEMKFSFEWASPVEDGGGAVQIEPAVARETLHLAGKIEKESTEEHEVVGDLVGFNKRTKRFEMFDPHSGMRYSGKIAEPALPAFRDITVKENWQYFAVINEVIEYEVSGEAKPSKFFLLELKPPAVQEEEAEKADQPVEDE